MKDSTAIIQFVNTINCGEFLFQINTLLNILRNSLKIIKKNEGIYLIIYFRIIEKNKLFLFITFEISQTKLINNISLNKDAKTQHLFFIILLIYLFY